MAIDYSIIVPAYNEEAWLPATLSSIQLAMSQSSLSGELIVCDNNSTDATPRLAREAGARVVFEAHNQISRARNRGAAEAHGRYLVFVDADTHISSELLQRALDNLSLGQCIGGGATVTMDKQLGRIERLGLWGWNTLSTSLGLAAGCFFYCRRDAYEAVSGFSEQVYASEELWLSKRLWLQGKKNGLRFCIIRHLSARSSGRKLDWFGPGRHMLLIVLLGLFPFLVRYRRFCDFWYKRPTE
jgi:glycosyltransferase involved in cell wall biosynthesis